MVISNESVVFGRGKARWDVYTSEQKHLTLSTWIDTFSMDDNIDSQHWQPSSLTSDKFDTDSRVTNINFITIKWLTGNYKFYQYLLLKQFSSFPAGLKLSSE